MFEGFRILFWGIFLITFHINLGPIAILPVFVGYMIVSKGIDHLQSGFTSPYYQRARIVSMLLTIFGVISFLLIWAPKQPTFMSYYPLIFSVLELCLVYYILEGTIEKFVADGEKELAGDYRSEQRTYTVLMTIYVIGMCIAITFAVGILSFIMVLLGLFLRLWLMVMLGRLKRTQQGPGKASLEQVASNYVNGMEENSEENQTDSPYEP